MVNLQIQQQLATMQQQLVPLQSPFRQQRMDLFSQAHLPALQAGAMYPGATMPNFMALQHACHPHQQHYHPSAHSCHNHASYGNHCGSGHQHDCSGSHNHSSSPFNHRSWLRSRSRSRDRSPSCRRRSRSPSRNCDRTLLSRGGRSRQQDLFSQHSSSFYLDVYDSRRSGRGNSQQVTIPLLTTIGELYDELAGRRGEYNVLIRLRNGTTIHLLDVGDMRELRSHAHEIDCLEVTN